MNKKRVVVLSLLVILFISIGFAALSRNLNITGLTSIKENRWNIYFDNVLVVEGNVSSVKNFKYANNNTEVSYNLTLNKPGDKYSFTINVVNDSTMDAAVNIFSYSNLTSEEKKVIDYSVTYADGSELKKNSIIKSEAYDTLKVSIEYKKDIQKADLPQSDINLSLTLNLEYNQAEITNNDRDTSNNYVIHDLSGNNRNGISYGAVKNEDGTFSTNGVDSYINSSLKGYAFNGTLSMVLRFKLNSFPVSGHVDIFGNGDVGGGGFSIGANKKIYSAFYIYNDSERGYIDCLYDTPLQLNEWYTIVTTVDSSFIKLYVNGVKVGETSVNGTLNDAPVSFFLGANSNYYDTKSMLYTAATYKSSLIFDRVLSEEEISMNYASEVNPTNKNDLLVYYEFR